MGPTRSGAAPPRRVVTPLLLISEIRTVAADTLWLSPFYGRDSIAFHFTWKPRPDEVLAVLPRSRPHSRRSAPGRTGASCSRRRAEDSKRVYPKLPEFRRLRERLDSGGKFRNEFIARYVG